MKNILIGTGSNPRINSSGDSKSSDELGLVSTNSTQYLIILSFLALLFGGCNKDKFTVSSAADDFFFLEHKGAKMPIQVQGNTASGKMIILLHGGPGGSGLVINEAFDAFLDPLEADYGMVYYDQRGAGTSQGAFDESTLNPAQFVEDLERLTTLILDKYGDVELYLMGISWGGYLGNAFLAKDDNQAKFSGWINLVGAHDFVKIAELGREKMIFYGNQQIALGNNTADWQEILDKCDETPIVNDKESFIQINGTAYEAMLLMEDSLTVEIEPLAIGAQLALAFTSPYDVNAQLTHQVSVRESQFLDRIIEHPLQAVLPDIQLPLLVLGGNYDFVVPTGALEEQFDLYGSEDKSLVILPNSSHQVISEEVTEAVENITEFVDAH